MEEEYIYKELSDADRIQALRVSVRNAEAALYRVNIDIKVLQPLGGDTQNLREERRTLLAALKEYEQEVNRLAGA